jgi:hypothetical protein
MSSTAPQPALLFSFNGSNVETITGLTPTLSLSTSYTTGKYGQAIYFNGTAGALPATSNIVYSVPSFTVSSFTVSLWVNATSLASGGNTTILAWRGYNNEGDLRIFFNGGTTSTTIVVVYPFVTGSFIGATSPTSFPIGQWVHVASTITVSPTSNVITNYYNGISAGSVTSATRNNSSPLTTLALGSFTNGLYNGQFNGLVQDLRIYNTALSASQIFGIYQSQGIPPRLTATSNVVQPSLLFSFQGNLTDSITGLSGSAVIDSTTNVPPTAPGVVSYVNGKYGQALQLTNAQTTPFQSGNNFVYWTIPSINKVTTSVSVSFWLNLNSLIITGGQQTILVMPGSGHSDGDLRFELISSGMIFSSLSGGASAVSSAVPVLSSIWNHFCGVYSTSGTVTLYTNGVASTTGTNASIVAGTLTAISLGRYVTVAGGYGYTPFSGLIQDLRIYNTALSAPQIFGIYQSQGIPPRLTLTGATGGLPSPTYAWQYEGTTADVGGLQGVNYGPSQFIGSVSYLTTGVPSGSGQSNAASFTGGAPGTYISTGQNWNLGRSGAVGSNIFVEALVYVNSFPCTIAIQGPPLATAQWWCGFNSQGYFSANVYAGSVQQSANCIGTPVSIGTWANVAFTYQQNTATSNTLFVWTNGTSQALNTFTGTIPNTYGNWYIGSDTNVGSMTGYIADLRIIVGGTPITSLTFSNAVTPYSLVPYTGTNNSEVVYTIQSQFSNSFTTSGKYGQALSNTQIKYTISSFPAGTAMTASMWVNINQQPRYVDTFFNCDNFTMSTVNNTGETAINNGSPYFFIMQNGSSLYNVSNGTAQRAALNIWTHIVGVCNSTGYCTYYINGTLASLGTPQQSVPVASTTIYIGGRGTIFKGLVDDVRIYNTALSPAQIQTIYQSGGNLYGGNLVQPTYLWPFNGSTTDIITNKAPSSANINTSYTTTLPITWPYYDTINQKYGRASITCNGNSGNVLYYNNLSVLTPGSTVTAWVKVLGYVSGTYPIFNIYPAGQNGFYIWPDSVGRLNWTLYVGGPSGGTFVSAPTSPGNVLNVWSHVAVSFSSTSAAMYLNGNQFTTLTYSTLLTNAANTWTSLSLGSWQYLGKEGSPCEISDFRIYNTALSTSQIQGIYLSGGAPPSAVLTSG